MLHFESSLWVPPLSPVFTLLFIKAAMFWALCFHIVVDVGPSLSTPSSLGNGRKASHWGPSVMLSTLCWDISHLIGHSVIRPFYPLFLKHSYCKAYQVFFKCCSLGDVTNIWISRDSCAFLHHALQSDNLGSTNALIEISFKRLWTHFN